MLWRDIEPNKGVIDALDRFKGLGLGCQLGTPLLSNMSFGVGSIDDDKAFRISLFNPESS